MPTDFENVCLMGKTGSDQRIVRTTQMTQADMSLGTNESGFSEEPPDGYRLSRHAIRYKGDLRTSSTAVLDTPMSASSRSLSWRSSLPWYCRSNPGANPAIHASGILHDHLFQDHLKSGNEVEASS
jgi:hypothetical protein